MDTADLEIVMTPEQIEQMVREMFTMQAELNRYTNGESWLTGITKDGKDIDWLIATKQELSEALDCFDWKHWKNIHKPFDITNYKMELLDIVHFVMSLNIKIAYDTIVANDKEAFGKKLAEYPYADIDKKPYDTAIPIIIESIMTALDFGTLKLEIDKNVNLIEEHTLLNHPELSGAEHKEEFQIRMLLNLTKHLIVHFVSYEDFITNILHIFECLNRYYNFTFLDVYKMYIGKNTLNKFRQDHGYKEGTYVKIWYGHEDNVYVHRYLENATLPDMATLKIMSYLDDMYADVIKEPVPDIVAPAE